VALRVAAETSQPFFERNIDLPHEAMSVINVKDQDAFGRSRNELRRVRRAHVKVALQIAFGVKGKTQAEETEKLKQRSHEAKFWLERSRASISQNGSRRRQSP